MTFSSIIRTQSDLESSWRHHLQPLGFRGHSLWFMLIGDDDRPLPGLTEIEDSENVPGGEELEALGEMLACLLSELAPGGRVAFLLSRPGRDGITSRDRDWAAALCSRIPATGVAMDVVHLANDVTVLPLPMDELLARASA